MSSGRVSSEAYSCALVPAHGRKDRQDMSSVRCSIKIGHNMKRQGLDWTHRPMIKCAVTKTVLHGVQVKLGVPT